MIDTWLKNDLNLIYKKYPVAVFIDESGDAEFFLKSMKDEYTIHKANSDIEELHIKYLIERDQPSSQKYLIYTRRVKGKLKFIREYCEINGCLEIRYLQNYIKDKVHQTLNLNINLPNDELIAAAKISVGKSQTYWMDLSHKGASEIFDLKKELLPFLNDPETYSKEKYDAQLRETFYRKINDLLKQEYISKPAKTLASEVIKAMLDGLATGSCDKTLESVYCAWLDSVSYKQSFSGYLNDYKVSENVDTWKVNPSHPFRTVDEQWLTVVGGSINSKESLSNYIAKISQRNQNKQAQSLGVTFWGDVKILLKFDAKDIAYLSSFSECIEFYTKHFYKLDTAIRNLYAEFIHKKDLLEPFQEHYKQILSIFLDKWFKYFDGYEEGQTGVLQGIIDDNNVKTAVIVGDGITYEIACKISQKANGNYKLIQDIILADMPSETENNMSRIYMANGVTEKVQSNREKYLRDQNTDKSVDFIKLDDLNDDANPSQYLICTYKDIDAMGEKLQHKALKYFPESIDYFAEKISLLLSAGYSKVYLIADHGFVLTGLLSEADKITTSLDGSSAKAERYIRSVKQQVSLTDGYIEVERKYDTFNYLYFSKTMSPFKTPGVYGFSHGGVSPQELITPFFCWEQSGGPSQALKVSIQNKEDLKNVSGEIYQVKIQSGKGSDLFSINRKVFFIFFSNKVQINKSDIFTIQKEQIIAKEYTFDGNTEIEIQLLDANTKEQLDRAVIKKNKDRDLGGLI